ncbi:hypothetical protein U1839_22135 [Sphingomonas sp. RT2P30]|uniref:hypothetical protein n=1 Tax=Parasphingomonas halimpatiens TaxID=3096162 RepID=UPI002FCBDB8F
MIRDDALMIDPAARLNHAVAKFPAGSVKKTMNFPAAGNCTRAHRIPDAAEFSRRLPAARARLSQISRNTGWQRPRNLLERQAR